MSSRCVTVSDQDLGTCWPYQVDLRLEYLSPRLVSTNEIRSGETSLDSIVTNGKLGVEVVIEHVHVVTLTEART